MKRELADLAAEVVRTVARKSRAQRAPAKEPTPVQVGLSLSPLAYETLNEVPRGLRSLYVSDLIETYVPPKFRSNVEREIACARAVKEAFQDVFGSPDKILNRSKGASSDFPKDARWRSSSTLKGSEK